MTPMYLSGSVQITFNPTRASEWRWRFTRTVGGFVGIIPFGRIAITIDAFKVEPL